MDGDAIRLANEQLRQASEDLHRYENRNRVRVNDWLAGSADWSAASESEFGAADPATAAGKPASSSANSRANAIARQANVAFKDGDYSRAAALYSHAIETGPSSYSVLINRSLTYLKLGDFKNALGDADAAISLRPNEWKPRYRRARALLELSRLSIEESLSVRGERATSPTRSAQTLADTFVGRLSRHLCAHRRQPDGAEVPDDARADAAFFGNP